MHVNDHTPCPFRPLIMPFDHALLVFVRKGMGKGSTIEIATAGNPHTFVVVGSHRRQAASAPCLTMTASAANAANRCRGYACPTIASACASSSARLWPVTIFCDRQRCWMMEIQKRGYFSAWARQHCLAHVSAAWPEMVEVCEFPKLRSCMVACVCACLLFCSRHCAGCICSYLLVGFDVRFGACMCSRVAC